MLYQLVLNMIFSGVVFFLGLFFLFSLSRGFGLSFLEVVVIYVWHTLLSIVYVFYVIENGGDAIYYYEQSLSLDGVSGFLGTSFVILFTSLFTVFLNLDFLSTSLVFQTLGCVGLLSFYASMKVATQKKTIAIRLLAVLVVFLPSASFWSSSIGKDSWAFMCAGLALWASLCLHKRLFLMSLAILLMMLVRPHVSILMFFSLTLSLFFQSTYSIFIRLSSIVFLVVLMVVLVPFVLDYAGVVGGLRGVMTYVEDRQLQNLGGGSSIDITNMSFFEKLFAYMFTPLPLQAHNVSALAASIENLLLLLLFIWGLLAVFKNVSAIKSVCGSKVFTFLYIIMSWSMLAMTTANLGIAVRQKWMIMPMLLFLIFSVVGRKRNKELFRQ